MAKRQIFREDAACLYKKCRPVEKFDRKLWELLDDMADTMYQAEGVGLAAPQVGILRRVVVVDIGDGLIEMVNPEIISFSGEQTGPEGCLSVPELRSKVKRPRRVALDALDLDGNPVHIEGEGYYSACMQHETDHLDGKLFIDHISYLKRSMYDKKMKKSK